MDIVDVVCNYSSESTHKFRESLFVAPTKLCAPISQISNAWSPVLATPVPALLDVVNSVKKSQLFFTYRLEASIHMY
jgi:hypothetical protein